MRKNERAERWKGTAIAGNKVVLQLTKKREKKWGKETTLNYFAFRFSIMQIKGLYIGGTRLGVDGSGEFSTKFQRCE